MNVPSLNASGRQALKASLALTHPIQSVLILSSSRCEHDRSPRVIAQPQIASHDMLQQPDRLSIDKRIDHVAKDSPNGVEPLIGLTDVS